MKYQKENAINASLKGPDANYLDGIPVFKTYPNWINKEEMDYLIGEFQRSGMRGPLNRYRAQQIDFEELLELTGKKIKQPAAFLTGSIDPVNFFTGSNYKSSDDLKSRIEKNYEHLIYAELLEDTGHWIQQEKPKGTQGNPTKTRGQTRRGNPMETKWRPRTAQESPKTPQDVQVATEMPKESYQNAVCNTFSQRCASEWHFKQFS